MEDLFGLDAYGLPENGANITSAESSLSVLPRSRCLFERGFQCHCICLVNRMGAHPAGEEKHADLPHIHAPHSQAQEKFVCEHIVLLPACLAGSIDQSCLGDTAVPRRADG